MKSLFSLLVLMVACTFSFATVRTLCNMSYCAGTYTNFIQAQDDSSNGDTIYVQGSTIDYGNISITKSLVIIGTGHHPAKQNPLVSSFLEIDISANNVQLIGLRFTNLFTSSTLSKCMVKKCRILGSSANNSINLNTAIDWLIEGNIIEAPLYTCIFFGGTSAPGTVIQHNIFLSSAEKFTGLNNNSSQRTYFINNIFLGQFSNQNTFFDVKFSNFDNNIFYSSQPTGILFSDCFMNNNVSYAAADNSFTMPGLNNIMADPKFLNYPGFGMYDYAWDLSLDPSSLGHNHGIDGKDVGVFGGTGFKFTETGEPSIAEITAFTITSPATIPPGGSLTISVTSKRVP
jgi:hypothetical protein